MVMYLFPSHEKVFNFRIQQVKILGDFNGNFNLFFIDEKFSWAMKKSWKVQKLMAMIIFNEIIMQFS